MGFLRRIVRWNKSNGGIFFPEELGKLEALRDSVEVRGFLSIYQMPVDDDGHPVREKARCLDAGDNLIVNSGRAALRALQAGTVEGGTAFGDFDLGYLAVGNGSSGGATTPQPTDTSLATELTDPVGGPVVSGVPRPLLNVTAPPPGPPFTVNLWSAQIGTSQLNGESIDEAGLYCLDDSTLFSYRTFPGQAKAAGFVLELRWSHIF